MSHKIPPPTTSRRKAWKRNFLRKFFWCPSDGSVTHMGDLLKKKEREREDKVKRKINTCANPYVWNIMSRRRMLVSGYRVDTYISNEASRNKNRTFILRESQMLMTDDVSVKNVFHAIFAKKPYFTILYYT